MQVVRGLPATYFNILNSSSKAICQNLKLWRKIEASSAIKQKYLYTFTTFNCEVWSYFKDFPLTHTCLFGSYTVFKI